jgi:hypothetical protein
MSSQSGWRIIANPKTRVPQFFVIVSAIKNLYQLVPIGCGGGRRASIIYSHSPTCQYWESINYLFVCIGFSIKENKSKIHYAVSHNESEERVPFCFCFSFLPKKYFVSLTYPAMYFKNGNKSIQIKVSTYSTHLPIKVNYILCRHYYVLVGLYIICNTMQLGCLGWSSFMGRNWTNIE